MERNVKKLETGIQGLDQLLWGGIPIKSQVLIAGGPGTGKTEMAMQIIYHSAKSGIPSAFITLDERRENLIKNFKITFPDTKGIDELISSGMLSIEGDDAASKVATNTEPENSYTMGTLMSDIESIIRTINAEMVVIDSLSFLKLMLGKTTLYNKTVCSIISNLRRMDVTAVMTSDIPYYSRKRLKFAQEMLLFDGLITLYHLGAENKEELALEVIKMRGSNHERRLFHYDINSSGIIVR